MTVKYESLKIGDKYKLPGGTRQYKKITNTFGEGLEPDQVGAQMAPSDPVEKVEA